MTRKFHPKYHKALILLLIMILNTWVILEAVFAVEKANVGMSWVTTGENGCRMFGRDAVSFLTPMGLCMKAALLMTCPMIMVS